MVKQAKTVRIKLVKSVVGKKQVHKDTVKALGISKIRQVVEKPDNPSVRGMLASISHLVSVEEVK